MSSIETVINYIDKNINDDNIKNFIDYKNDLLAQNNSYNKSIYDSFFKFIKKDIMDKIKDTLKSDYHLRCNISDHFIMRLICRFGDTPVDFIMNDISRAYNNRSKYSKEKGRLQGNFYKVVYSEKDNILITITTFFNYNNCKNRHRKKRRS